MPRYRDIIYSFDFLEENRSSLYFSDDDKLRLDPIDHRLKLKIQDSGKYSTDDDLHVISQELYPKTNKLWKAFQAFSNVPSNTFVNYRLHDGTNHKYWNGSAWITAGTSDWNTETEVIDNIDKFPLGKIRIVANLKTTDGLYTPYVESYLLGYSAQIVFLDNWVYRSLVPLIRENIRPIARWPVVKLATSSQIDLNNFTLDNPFNIVDIDSVYDHTSDSDHENDLFDSYNSSTKVITLSSSITQGNTAWINFIYEPEVAALVSTDYYEARKVPLITLENIRLESVFRGAYKNDLINKSDDTAIQYYSPWQCILRGSMVISAPTGVDEFSLSEEILSFAMNNQQITIQGTGEKVDLILNSPYNRSDLTEFSNLRQSSWDFEIRWLKAWLKSANTNMYSVKNLQLTGDIELII